VQAYQELRPTARGTCVDHACEFFGRRTKMRGQKSSAFAYCAHCGSRSVDGRLVSSFNLGHGTMDIDLEKVQKARADLAKWWQALDQVSRDLALSKGPARGRTVLDVFHLAEVPSSPRLRATRLGLVWLVRRNLGKKVGIPPRWPAIVRPNARWNHPVDIGPFVRPARKDPRRRAA
jgi:hypothetical protein